MPGVLEVTETMELAGRDLGKGRETVRLSKRLEAVAGMVTKGNMVCDVGCDHGFVSIDRKSVV